MTELGQQALLDPEPTRVVRTDRHAWWGVDTSTLRVSIAWIFNDGERGVRCRSFSRYSSLGKRLDAIRAETAELGAAGGAAGLPGFVFVEQPFAGKHGVPPISYMVMGVIAAAVFSATGAEVEPIPPPKWKSVALGNGGANKDKVAEWAKLNGCPSDLQDDADAWAIAEAARRTVRFA